MRRQYGSRDCQEPSLYRWNQVRKFLLFLEEKENSLVSRLVRAFTVCLLVTSSIMPTIASARRSTTLPTLTAYGEKLPNACMPQELASIESTIRDQTATQNSDEAWAVIKALLCGTDRRSEEIVRQHSVKRLLAIDEDAGQDGSPQHSIHKGSLDFMLRGHAWSASADLGAGTDLRVSVWVNEVGIQGYILRFRGGHWLLVGLDSASD